jgi:xanthine dehydrogenase accessory factor
VTIFRNELCLIRGGGDIATGVVARLHHAGFPIVVTELPFPLAVRRSVSVANAVYEKSTHIENMSVQLVDSVSKAITKSREGIIAVLVNEGIPKLDASIVIDGRLAKKNIDTKISDANIVVGLGPGFTAGRDCDFVIETKRGHFLGRVIKDGKAIENTGRPEPVEGRGDERVLRSPKDGQVQWNVEIGESVVRNQTLGSIAEETINAPFDGVVRGLIHPLVMTKQNMKIGDIDPRQTDNWRYISDKALSIGGGVLEAVFSCLKS